MTGEETGLWNYWLVAAGASFASGVFAQEVCVLEHVVAEGLGVLDLKVTVVVAWFGFGA